MKLQINDDGSAHADNAHEGNENAGHEGTDGKPTPAIDRWGFNTPDQLEKHLRGVESDKAHPFRAMSKGDISAARDLAHERAKKK